MNDIDAGQVAALLASDDRAALDIAARDWNGPALRAVADGTDLAHTSLHVVRDRPGLVISETAREAARAAMELRGQGHQIVAGTLNVLGYEFSELVNILPYAIPGAAGALSLGLVNNSEGIAVATNVALPQDVVDALSGTCGWEGPSVPVQWGPDGWVRIRAEVTGAGLRPVKLAASIAWWCLPVTYGEPIPGWTALHGQYWRERAEPQDWPDNGTRDAMNAAGRDALIAIARELAGIVGCLDTLNEGLAVKASVTWEVPPPARTYFSDTSFASATSAVIRPDHFAFPRPAIAEGILDDALGQQHGAHGPCSDACDGAGVTQLARACEAPLAGHLIAALLGRLAWDALLPIARATTVTYPGPREPVGDSWRPVYERRREMSAALRQLARTAADNWLREVLRPTVHGNAAGLAMKEMGRIYSGGGQPVAVDIPLPVPGHLPYPPDEPVGLAEIFARLHVKRGTADRWRQRNVLPPPDWPTVGGRPAWKWGTIAQWWTQRGGPRDGDEPEGDG
jgi:hypothetical protein